MKTAFGFTLIYLVITSMKTASAASHGCPDELSTCEEFCDTKGYVGGQCDGDDCFCYKYPDIPAPTTAPDTNQVSETSHGCPDNVMTCSKHCRNQGYNFAICSNNECTCSEDPKKNTTVFNDSSDMKVLQNSFGCPTDQLQCSLNCVILKYISGTCYKNQCVCRSSLLENNIPTTIRTTDNLLAMDTNGCPDDVSTCENYCDQLGYSLAKCSENQCICQSNSVIPPSAPDDSNQDIDTDRSQGCPDNLFSCFGYCQKNGHSSAECKLDQCICGGKSSKNAEVSTKSPDTFVLKGSLGCPDNPITCALQCIGLNYTSANCMKDRCICQRNKLESSSSKPEVVSETLKTENPYGCPESVTSCNKYCIKNGYTSAECTGKHCTCMKTSMKSMINPTLFPQSFTVKKSNGCPDDVESCKQYCSELGHTSAICDDDRCTCSSASNKVIGGDTEALDSSELETYEVPAPKSLENCQENPIECAEYCILHGYIRAKCRNNECMCLSNASSGFSIPNILMQALTTRSPDNNPFCKDYCKEFGFIFANAIDGQCSCVKTVVNNDSASKILTQTMTTDNSNGCPENVFSCQSYCGRYGYTSAVCKGSKCNCIALPTEVALE